ncbi:hypothetical protein [Pseudorhodobacter aquimaris]|uniref:hypothetical protein n=1 Tax=Pseudorhodobacter aquimaris TaxID=687412 RepID=UPI000B2AAF03|nr:hypothetical protein [Pseudorhodobacter aquimaris]
MDDPIALIELGFRLACEKHEQTHYRWRALHHKLEQLRGNDAPYDAGNHDARIDCLLREMEDDQVRYICATGKRSAHPNSRTKLQIQLSRYWISSTYELLRTTSQAMGQGSEFFKLISKHKHMFAAYRVPISKQEPHRVAKPSLIQELDLEQSNSEKAMKGELPGIKVLYEGSGSYRVKPLFDLDSGSIGFVVYDGKAKTLVGKPRRELSDMNYPPKFGQ